MRHVHRPVRVCRLHTLLPALLFCLAVAPAAAAQVALAGGYTWQRASSGPRDEHLGGPSLELVSRVAPRIGIVFAADRFGYPSTRVRDGFTVTSLRTGVRFLLVRERAVDFGFGLGLGLHTLDVGREEGGAGSTVFAELHLAAHPVRYLGVFLAGNARSMSGFGQGLKGNSAGVTLGIQLRSPGW